MINGKDVYLKARSYVGTGYQHQARLPGKKLDCIGLPICVARELGIGDFEHQNYPRNPDGRMLELIESVCPKIVIQPGALLVFQIRSIPQHCGIVSADYMGGMGLIHATEEFNGVVEHRLTRVGVAKCVGVFGFPGVEYEQQ